MEASSTFGYWVKRRRKALDWTQAELGSRVGASAAMIRKIEADERRPSRELAELLAEHLAVPAADREAFLRAARDLSAIDALTLAVGPVDSAPLWPSPTNLPAPMTSMVNRVRDLAAVGALIRREDVRLITILGPPGMGKTRLSIQAARQALPHFPQGVWFVDLSAIVDPALVLSSIAMVLGLALGPGQPPGEQLKQELRERRMLLVLDNFEQVVAEASHDVAALLKACPGLKILITSRMRLDVYGEFEYPLSPMSLPQTGEQTPEALLAYEAVQLFVARAQQHQPHFELTAATAPLVAEICRRMDGLPLALELAAARVRRMPVDELAVALREASGRDWHALLHTTARDLPPRQQTLFDAIAWSYDLLVPEEKAALRRLGVFAGAFDTAAAAAVWADLVENDTAARALLEHLLDQNLVSRDSGGPDRHRLMEMIREFALAQMDESEVQTAKLHHMRHYAMRQSDWNVVWLDPAYLEAIETELDNYRAAIGFAIETGDAFLAHLLGASLGRFWERRGLLNEGRAVLARILALSGHVGADARFAVMHEATILAWMQHDFETAEALAETSLNWARNHGESEDVITFFNMLGRIYLEQARYDDADRVLAEAIVLCQRSDPPRPAGMLAIQQGEAALARGELDQAERSTRYGLESVTANDLIPYCLGWNNLAEVGLASGDIDLARRALKQVLPLARFHSRRLRIFLVTAAGLKLDESLSSQEVENALRLLSYVATANERMGDPLSPMTQRQLASRIEITRDRLPADRWRVAWDEGQRLTQDLAVALSHEILK